MKCSRRRAGNQLVMPDRNIDARDGVKRRESSHAYFLNLRPPREVVAFVPAPRSNPRVGGLPEASTGPAGVGSRPRGLLSQLQLPGPFIGHGVRTSQPQARHERPKWCRSHSFGKAGSGLECRPTSRRPVVDANAKSALARCLPTSGAQCRSRDTKRRYQRP